MYTNLKSNIEHRLFELIDGQKNNIHKLGVHKLRENCIFRITANLGSFEQ